MTRDLGENIKTARQIKIDLLFTDVDLALTFVQNARESLWPETKKTSLAHALKAYTDISAKRLNLDMPDTTCQELERKLQDLAQALTKQGISV